MELVGTTVVVGICWTPGAQGARLCASRWADIGGGCGGGDGCQRYGPQADLLNIARKEKSKLTENCAIALARLASGHPEHIARLRQLGGFEVLHSRSPVAVPR